MMSILARAQGHFSTDAFLQWCLTLAEECVNEFLKNSNNKIRGARSIDVLLHRFLSEVFGFVPAAPTDLTSPGSPPLHAPMPVYGCPPPPSVAPYT